MCVWLRRFLSRMCRKGLKTNYEALVKPVRSLCRLRGSGMRVVSTVSNLQEERVWC